jgi:RimJ/RimL family protein N-acetyltransferase
MAAFGGRVTWERSREWLLRLLAHWQEHRFGRFFVEDSSAFVGVIGLSRTDFDAGIVPDIEIAWRLAYDHWGKGYATEAARAVIDDGFCRLGIRSIVGATTPENLRSQRVMERLGMKLSPGEAFEHPQAPGGHPNRTYIVYRLSQHERRDLRGSRDDQSVSENAYPCREKPSDS